MAWGPGCPRVAWCLLVAAIVLGALALADGLRLRAAHEEARTALRSASLLLHGAQLLAGRVGAAGVETVARTVHEAGHPDLSRRAFAVASLPEGQREIRARALRDDLERRARDTVDRVDRRGGWREEATLSIVGGAILAALAAIGALSRRRGPPAIVSAAGGGGKTDYDRLLDTIPVAAIGFTEGRGLFANDAWAQIDCLGDRDPLAAFLGRVVDEDREEVRETLARVERTRTPEVVQAQVRTFSRGTLHMEVRVAPVFTPEGDLRHFLAFCLDTTPVFRAEQLLQIRNDEVERVNRELSRMLDDLEEGLESVVRAMVRTIEAKDGYTAGHSERVKTFSLWIGEELGLGPYERRILEVGALVHDIGKIGIPDVVLGKPGKLTDSEFEVIKSHPVRGVEIIEGIAHFEACLPIVRWHHEKLDGSGYPDGISGDRIPLLVRIATVADIFDAMTSSRSYRKAIQVRAVLDLLKHEADSGKLDRACVEALVNALTSRGLHESLGSPAVVERVRIAA